MMPGDVMLIPLGYNSQKFQLAESSMIRVRYVPGVYCSRDYFPAAEKGRYSLYLGKPSIADVEEEYLPRFC